MAVRWRRDGGAATTGHENGLEYGFECIFHLLLQRHFFKKKRGREKKLRLLSEEGVGVEKVC